MIGRAHPTPSGRAPEVVLADLLASQARRFAAVDPVLPPPPAPPPGEVLVVPDGSPSGTGEMGGRSEVAGVVTHHRWPAGSAPLLWSAAEVTELHPVPGSAGVAGISALLTAWRARVPSVVLAATDSSAIVTWPSRDVLATRAFLDHGLAPLAVLAIRHDPARQREQAQQPDPVRKHDPTRVQEYPASPATSGTADRPSDGLWVRRAGPGDLDACVRLAMEEISYSSHVGGSVLRPDAEAIKRTTLRDRLGRDEPVWLAEEIGSGRRGAVGLLECGVTDALPDSWLAGLLPTGRWGYVNCAAVTASRRDTGVGRALLAAALSELTPTTIGTYLYYNPPNPLSSVFWPRHGYRPLWTLWETRPAAALR